MIPTASLPVLPLTESPRPELHMPPTTHQLLNDPLQAAMWLLQRVTGRLHADSREVRPGDGFIAWPGAATDGRRFVKQALDQGAAACLVEEEGVAAWQLPSEGVAGYAQLKAATGPVAAAFYGYPSRELALLAVTGTNGKTSTAWWLAQALGYLNVPNGYSQNGETLPSTTCAVIGTLGIGIPPDVVFNGLTTPDPVTLQHQLREFVRQGIEACALEASSIGIAERRLDGCDIRVAIFTNFTHDHLDYHGSMQAYWQAKAELFRWPGLQAAVINLDDPKGLELAEQLSASQPELALWTTSALQIAPGTARKARLCALHIRYAAHAKGYGLCFDVQEGGVGSPSFTVETCLIGQYNVSNLLGVVGALRAQGFTLSDAARACCYLSAVPGRMECWGQPEQPLAVIDYAHTPDALEKALTGLQPLVAQRGGQLWCVFGCGGARDATKRPLMATVAQKHADHVVVTSDNPRHEAPETIISQILQGIAQSPSAERPVHVEVNRAVAIAHAVRHAAPRDVVLIAGKGHEDYQDIGGTKYPFSDQQHALEALASRGDLKKNNTSGGAA